MACEKLFLGNLFFVDLRGCAGGGHVIPAFCENRYRGIGDWRGCGLGCFRSRYAGVQERFKGVGGEDPTGRAVTVK